MLSIKEDLQVGVEKAILRGLNLEIRPAKFTPLWGRTVPGKARSLRRHGGT